MSYTPTEPATLSPAPSAPVLDEHARGWRKKLLQTGLVLAVILIASWYVGLLDFKTLANGMPAIGVLLGELPALQLRLPLRYHWLSLLHGIRRHTRLFST